MGDIWALDISPLELQNADTKRVADKIGARRLELSTSGARRVEPRSGHGPANLVTTSGYATTLAISTMRNLLATRALRRGDGVVTMVCLRLAAMSGSLV